MQRNCLSPSHPRRRRLAYTLMELVVGMAASTLLMGGLSSSLYISSRALNTDNTSARDSSTASGILNDMMDDLRHAVLFQERTATAVTFTVPDRDGDEKSETIRYAWTGTPGDPLTYQYNDGTVVTLANSVKDFNLQNLTRTIPAGGDQPSQNALVTFEGFTEGVLDSDELTMLVSKPVGTSSGDLLIAAVATDGDNSSSLLATGWNSIAANSQDGEVTLAVWWKIAGAAEPASYSFEWGSNQEAYGWIMRFSGHDPVNPIDVFATDGGTALSPNSPAVSTSVDNTMILRLAGFDDDDINSDVSGLSGHVTITADQSGSSFGSASAAAGIMTQNTAGDSGTSNFELQGTEQYRAVTIAIAPEPEN